MSNIKIIKSIKDGCSFEEFPNNIAQSVSTDVIILEGVSKKRKRLLLNCKPCSVGSCIMCILPKQGTSKSPSPEELVQQISSNLTTEEDFQILTLFQNGNFFSDKELTEEHRIAIYKYLEQTKIECVQVESLPQFITSKKLEVMRQYYSKGFEVKIGLQTQNEYIRKNIIYTTSTTKSFENAQKNLKDYNCSLSVFLLYKPPFLTTEESMKEIIDSCNYVAKLGVENPIICPLVPEKNTLVYELLEQGQYIPCDEEELNLLLLYLQQYCINTPKIAISLFNGKSLEKETLNNISKFNSNQNIESGKELPLLNDLDILKISEKVDCFWSKYKEK